MLAGLWAKLYGWVAMGAAVVLVLIGAYAYGHRAAKRAAEVAQEYEDARRRAATDHYRAESAKARVKQADAVIEVHREVERLPPGGADAELRRRWMRDEPKV